MESHELLRGVRVDADFLIPGATVRQQVRRRSSLIVDVELVPPRTLRLMVRIGPLVRPVDLHLREEVLYRPGEWLEVGDIAGPIGAVLRAARALKIKEEIFTVVDVRNRPGPHDELAVNLPRLVAGSRALDALPSDADIVIADLHLDSGDLAGRLLAAL